MSKNKITIDLDKWGTPKQIAKELGYNQKNKVQRICNWIYREKVITWEIEELNIILVDRSSLPDHT